ncbi:hypothetical protein, partial [Lacticaseibacillus paracasei]|uniref:hypothetical protein n=1 Tax=Lacticaseibacillus paracasei TaxID=1597 RepID=UPI0034A39895
HDTKNVGKPTVLTCRFPTFYGCLLQYNLGATKLAAKMYLVGGRYGEYFSMLGYAKRAQSIMSNNGDNYRVEILNQIRKQIRINQQRVHAFRSGKNLNSLIKE